jgi:hypothetical protein
MVAAARTRVVFAAAVVALGLSLWPGSVARLSAWGAQGHHVVARIAWGLLTPTARERASAILGGGQDDFVSSATWADDVRSQRPETANWHFVDIPVEAAHYEATRDCRPTEKGDCVVAEIGRARAEVADLRRSPEARAESLKFLIHFVGDIHQPLHDVDDHDKGGNDVRVTALRGEGGRATNLHSAWDTGLINLTDETEAARATRLSDDLAQHPVKTTGDAVAWAEEGHELATHVAYHYPGFSPAGPPIDPITLSSAYRTAALGTIDQQLERGGARLGAILNALLGAK